MKGLSCKHFLVWRFLQQSGARVCQWSVRKIHVALGISRSTVEKALKALNAIGFIRTRPGSYNRASEHEILQTLAPATPAPEFTDAPAPNFRDSEGPSGENRDTPPEKSGHPPAAFCSACGQPLGEDSRVGSRASVIDDEARARLTTDRLSDTESKQASQSVLGWLRDRFGRVGDDLERRAKAAVGKAGDPEEWIVRFFDYKWPEVQDRVRRRVLPYATAGLFVKAINDGELRAWKNLFAEELAREMHFKARVDENARKGMTVEETLSGFDDPVAEAERLKASLRAMGASA